MVPRPRPMRLGVSRARRTLTGRRALERPLSPSPMDLHTSVAAVTGASRGIGRAVAAQLVSAGARVFGLARSEGDLEAVQTGLGDAFVPVVCDVTDGASVEAAIERVADEGGQIDLLVNNAGLGRFADVDALDESDWHLQVDTNLTGLYRCTAAAVPHMKRLHERTGRTAHIVNVASIAGLIGNPGLSAYNATKFGVRGFSESTMKELRPHGIKVSCVYPGSVDTHFGDGAGTSPNPHAMAAEDVASTVLHVVQTPPGYLVSEVVMRPMKTRG